MRDYLNTASPEALSRLAQLNTKEREATLQACDRMFVHIEGARDNLPADEYREFLEWLTTALRIKALAEVEH